MSLGMIILAGLAGVSFVITLWQFIVALRFPLHRRIAREDFLPPVTLLKPLQGAEAETKACLASWLKQDYRGPVQLLFGVASEADPAVATVKELLAEYPEADARLIICGESSGTNPKVSKLIRLGREARHEIIIISDADVRVPADFLANVVAPLRLRETGLVHCFYQLANPANLAMRCEAVAVNGDFWSQVLQAASLKPVDFALGAVMALRKKSLEEIGGFESLKDYLADDYRLGNQVQRRGWRLEFCPVVVECWEPVQNWRQVLRHQLRWARTIRACRPVPYFFSLLSNGTLWPVLLMLTGWQLPYTGVGCFLLAVRAANSLYLQYRLTRSRTHQFYDFLVIVSDLLQVGIWALALAGNRIEWRGTNGRLNRDGKLTPA